MRKIILSSLAVIVLAVVGAGAYVWFSGGSGEPSTEVTAPPVTAAAETTAATEPAVVEDPAAAGAPEQVVFAIDKEQSSVQFTLGEVLRGDPMTVVGTTNELAGEVLVDFTDPASSQLGEIVINARTFSTGSGFRDRAVRGPILGSADDEFEFATFVPTSLEGLPQEAAVGDEVTFTVTGEFTIAGVTNPVTFEVTLLLAAEDRIEGSGSATVTRTDFGLTIPDAPGVADVSEEVDLQIDFVAVAG